MTWLLHNVVADLYGPYFLAFYALAIVAVIVASYVSVRSVDRTQDLASPQVPKQLDPYEFAYLRGGENEVARVAIASLVQRGLLKIAEKGTWNAKARTIDLGRLPAPGELGRIEAGVIKWARFPATPQSIFHANGVRSMLTEPCARYEAALAENNLLTPREVKETGARLWLFGSAIIVALGGYKLAVALTKGHNNVAFLCVLGIGGVVCLGAACMRRPRLSHLGKAYLERVKSAYIDLKDQIKQDARLADIWDVSGDTGKARAATAYSDGLLAVGIFGVAALADTPLADLNTMFARGTRRAVGAGPAAAERAAVAAAGAVAAADVAAAVGVAEAKPMIRDLPVLGVGVGFREPFLTELFRHRDRVDFLEVTADHYFDAPEEKHAELELLAGHFPIIPHGLDLSLGSGRGDRRRLPGGDGRPGRIGSTRPGGASTSHSPAPGACRSGTSPRCPGPARPSTSSPATSSKVRRRIQHPPDPREHHGDDDRAGERDGRGRVHHGRARPDRLRAALRRDESLHQRGQSRPEPRQTCSTDGRGTGWCSSTSLADTGTTGR